MKSFFLGFVALLFLPYFAKAEANFLLVGDSHTVGAFGEQLLVSLGGAQNTLRYAISGAHTGTWLKDPVCSLSDCKYTYGFASPRGAGVGRVPAGFPGLASLLQADGNAKLVIALGTNDAVLGCEHPMSSESYKNVRKLLAMIPQGSHCVWVGPPKYHRGPVHKHCGENYERYVNVLKSLVEHTCRYIDSRLVIDPETGRPIEADSEDEVHFSKRLGSVWAKTVAPKIRAR